MKSTFSLGRRVIDKIQSLWRPAPDERDVGPAVRGRAESLFRLHETQNRVIVSIYKISIAGLVATFLILLSFTLFLLTDPFTPSWVSYMLVAVEGLLVVGFVRTLQEFQIYQKHYQEVSGRLRELMRQQFAQSTGPARSGEHRLLSALKPKEHQGWDAKRCRHCDKAIEMTAEVCQHCGQEQEPVLQN